MQLPDALTALPQWVAYRIEKNDKGELTKVPYRADGRGKASSTNPDTWSDYKTALRGVIAHEFNGPGFVFNKGAGIVGIDLDHCINPETGEVEEWAAGVVARLDSLYGTSHLRERACTFIATARFPKAEKKDRLEMYDSGRYFTVTAQRYPGTPTTVNRRPDAVTALYTEWFAPEPSKPALPRPVRAEPHFLPNDSALLNKARNATNGHEFAALFDRGDVSAYNGDESRADLALAGRLLFWTGGDCDRSERLFTQSALGQRDKWQRADYRERTFSKAGEGMTEFYKQSDYTDLRGNRVNFQNPETDTQNTQNSGETDKNGNSVYSVYENQGNENSKMAWEPITPIGLNTLPTFPTDALPDWLRAYVEALATATETPADLAGLLALSACAFVCRENGGRLSFAGLDRTAQLVYDGRFAARYAQVGGIRPCAGTHHTSRS